jgi:type III pantothenate kinase
MDINLMVVNCGNSRISVGSFAAGELRYTKKLPAGEPESWPEAITAAWKCIAGSVRPAVAGASVNPGLDGPLNDLVMRATGEKIQWVGPVLELPIEVQTEAPAETGVDRVLNIAAAYEQLGKACAVVDAGTAVTVDFCNDKGDFIGGAIAPGLRMMLQSLHEKTARLPAVQFERPERAIGASTAAAISAGVYHAIRGLVREVVEEYATELGRWPEVIATGGDARELFEGWEVIHAISPDLTLYGIALAYVEHQINHEM